jgi:phosphoserine phosphatase RsbU/P
LPLSLTNPPDPRIAAAAGRVRQDLTNAAILVVDDNPQARALVVAQLQAYGYRHIEAAEDGYQALGAIKQRRPELIITDLLMPQMDGFEFCRTVRANQLTQAIPILAQTATTDPELRAQAFDSGCTDLFTKPCDPKELLSRVRILLERGRLIERLVEFQKLISEDLLQAAATQAALLPTPERLAELGTEAPLEVASHYEASVGLGGDLWGIEKAGNRRVLIFNADFAGHGVGAAFNTVRLHSFIHSNTSPHDTPAEVMTRLNRLLCEVLPMGQYATMFCAIMDFDRQSIEYSSAAAPPQLLRSAPGEPFMILREPGFPLGVTRSATFDNQVAEFAPGGTLLLFSDALIETPPPPDEAFDVTRLCDFVSTIPAVHGPHEIVHQVLRQLFASIREKPEDDLTLVAAHHVMQEDRS